MIRIGIIGAGGNARGHATRFDATDGVDVVAIADPAVDVGRALADEVGARHVEDHTQFLGDVDAVVVSSPNFLHAEHAVACADAGKHVYCEKPMGLNFGEASAIHEAVEAAGVASAVGFSPRLSRESQTMRKLVDDGRIGDVISVWSRRLMYMPDEKLAGWRADASRSGGLLLEINVHELDWMMYLAGPVESVYAQTRADQTTGLRANDHIWVTLNFTNHAVGQHEGSWRAATPNFYKGLHGSAGGATTNEWGNDVYYAPLAGSRETVDLAPQADLRARWLDAIRGADEPWCGTAWGLDVMRVAEAVFRSAETHAVVQVDQVHAHHVDRDPTPQTAGAPS
jgi:predicted dehydrogenase